MDSKLKFYFIVLAIYAFQGCNPAKHLPDNQHLVNSNKIEVKDADISTREVRNFIRQTPNRRILGIFPFYLNVYQYADNRSEGRFTDWLKTSIGEPPVIYNQVLTESTASQFNLYMQRKGYFNGTVDYEVEFDDRKKIADVKYTIKGNRPYKIRDIKYSIPDSIIAGFIFNDTVNSLLQQGEKYDADLLQEERNRINRKLRNQGFFNFSRDYIHFMVDSTVNDHKMDITLQINDPVKIERIDRRDSVITRQHNRYKINNIYIYPDYLAMRPASEKKDTTVYYHFNNENGNDTTVYYFLHHEPLQIRPNVIIKNIRFEPGDYYQLDKTEQSYSFLSALRMYRFANIVFDESPNNSYSDTIHLYSDTIHRINAHIQLTPAPANAFTVDGEGFNTAGNLGIGGNLIFQNRNIFGGAEIFNTRLKGALELSGDFAGTEPQRMLFNTVEFGGEIGFNFPDLLLPFRIERISTVAKPKTILRSGINFRQRPDYTRYVLSLTYGFEWSPSIQKNHNIFPVEISSIKVYNDSLLRSRIPAENPLILSSFSDHLISGMRYRYIYNTQQVGRNADFVYSIMNIETAGNLLRTAKIAMNPDHDKNASYTIFDIPFAQYVKADLDYRFYRIIDSRNTLVLRMMGGAGIPYGNRDVLPFIKSYYAGGANSMRAWPIYSLGPGSYSRENENGQRFYDRYGDIKIEANAEYRFDLYKLLKGAFFVEGGNVWFAKENQNFPGGTFKLNKFYKDIALGAGVGARFDFNFFVVRLDAAAPIRDPAKPGGQKWISSWPSFSITDGDVNYNIGIGYPF